MKYKQNFLIHCDEKCMYRNGEECTLTLEKFKNHEAEHTTRQMLCTGYPKSYIYDAVERQLWKERTTPCEPKEQEQMELVFDGDEGTENATKMTENSAAVDGSMDGAGEKFIELEAKEETLTGEIIPPYASYAEYKQELDREVRQEVEGYVHIGYLLKLARDTSILAESGYANLYDFAQAEYSIDKSRVSRYMAINDRFAKNGYSMELKDEYKGYGVAKLSMMLTLPDEINEELSPEMTKSEIQDIRDEVAEEQKITPMEHMLNGETETTEQGETLLQKVLLQMMESAPGLFVKVRETSYGTLLETEDVMQTLAPAGEMIYSVRIRGMGRFLLSLKDYEEYIAITNERTGEKEKYTWDEVTRELEKMHQPGMLAEEDWERLFGREFPRDEEVAPVQPERKVVKVNAEKPEKPHKVETAWGVKKEESPVKKTIKDRELEQKPVQESEPKQETLHEINKEIPKPEPVEEPEQEPECVNQETAYENAEEQQLTGQANIEDYPEYMPEAKKISVQDFNRKDAEYRNAYSCTVADSELAFDEGNWEKARMNLQNAMSVIDKMEALCSMELTYEEEEYEEE